MTATGRILALDYGARKVGVAASDVLRITAAPVGTIRYKSKPDLLQQLFRHIEDREIAEVVVGVPYTMDGGRSQFTDEVIEFVEWLTRQLDIPVRTIDERLSTHRAKNTLIEMGVKTGHQKEKVDAMAASHLLRDYLDLQANEGSPDD